MEQVSIDTGLHMEVKFVKMDLPEWSLEGALPDSVTDETKSNIKWKNKIEKKD